jgi:hypothetical protein
MMGDGSAAGGMQSGAVAAVGSATMTAPVYDPDAGAITIARVLAPSDGWVVARSVTSSGTVLGSVAVLSGENRDVVLRPRFVTGVRVRVALFVDRGVRGTFEFDAARGEAAPDKPVTIDGVPVETVVTLAGWGAEANPGAAALLVEDQKAGPSLEVNYLLVPAPSWVEVRRIEKGVPGVRLGLLLRPAGEFQRFAVPLEGSRSGDQLLVTVLADRGTPGTLDPAADDPLRALDQPWVSAGTILSQAVRLR